MPSVAICDKAAAGGIQDGRSKKLTWIEHAQKTTPLIKDFQTVPIRRKNNSHVAIIFTRVCVCVCVCVVRTGIPSCRREVLHLALVQSLVVFPAVLDTCDVDVEYGA